MALCPKCGTENNDGARFCRSCGANLSAAPEQKYVIEGGTLPLLTVRMAAGERLISQAGGRAWMVGPVDTEITGNGGGAFGRLLTGESLFFSQYTARGPAEISFASSFPGKIMAQTLGPGESIICQKSAFLCATYGVTMSVFFNKRLGAGLVGGEGFVMQKITGPGTVFLEIDGYCKEYMLGAGQQIVCDTGLLAYMDETCSLDVRAVKGLKNALFGGEGLFDTVITGPGKVGLQSMTVNSLASLVASRIPSK